jgi:hypothetical protein
MLHLADVLRAAQGDTGRAEQLDAAARSAAQELGLRALELR